MKSGEFIKDRLLPGFVRAAAKRQGIVCTSMSDDWVIRLEKEPKLRWVLGYQFDLNSAAASAIAGDKVATYFALAEAGVPTVEHILLRSLPGEPFPKQKITKAFTGPFVLKPLEGTGGRGVVRVENVSEAERIISESPDLPWAASPLLEIDTEYRVILLDGTPLVIYEKTQPIAEGGLKLFNLGKGATPVDVRTEDTKDTLETLARQACSALALRVASVDIVRVGGELRVLEVNDGIMMECYARHNEQYKKNAALVYDAIITTMFR